MRGIIKGKSILDDIDEEPNRQLDTDRPCVQYIRRSTETQKDKNLMSLVQQDIRLGEKLRITHGFTNIVKIDKDDGTSGQKLLEDRAGLTYLYDLIKGKKLIDGQRIAAVSAFDASRLWRDATHVWYNDFIQLLIEYNIPYISYRRVFWPNSKADMDALREEFKGAVKSLEVITERANPARLEAVGLNGSYGGHAIPIGYYITGIRTDRHYTVYAPYRELIAHIFERFKALNGNISRLLSELDRTGFHFPEMEMENPPHITLPHVKGVGYFIRTRGALVGLLSNVAYLGWYTYTTHEKAYYKYDEKKERRVKVKGVAKASYINENSHTAIITDRALFDWCYERVTGETLEGVVVVQRPERRYGVQTNAVLDGVLVCGENRVYAMANTNTYVARSQDDSLTYLVAPIADVDSMFGRVMDALVARSFLNSGALVAKINEVQEDTAAKAVDYQSKLTVIDKAIRGWEMDRQSAREKGYKAGLDEANENLANLARQRADIESSMNRTNVDAEKLSEASSLVHRLAYGWTLLPLDNKRRLVRLLDTKADIQEATPHIIRLSISLGTPVNKSMTVYFYRARGSQESWTDGENEVLRQLYPYADRAVILKALPMRTWKSTIMQANEIGVDRLTRENTSDIPVHMCFADCGLIRELGMEPGEAVWPVITPGVQDEPVNVDYPIDLHTLVKELRELIAA